MKLLKLLSINNNICHIFILFFLNLCESVMRNIICTNQKRKEYTNNFRKCYLYEIIVDIIVVDFHCVTNIR